MISQSEIDANTKRTEISQASTLKSGGTTKISGDSILIESSNIVGEKDIELVAKSGDVQIVAGKNNDKENTFHEEKELTFGFDFGEIEDIYDKGKISVEIAKATADSKSVDTESVTHSQSTVFSKNGKVSITAEKSIAVKGSAIASGTGAIDLTTKKSVDVTGVIDTKSVSTSKKHSETKISASLSNKYVDVAKAVEDGNEARKQIAIAKKAKDNHYANKGRRVQPNR